MILWHLGVTLILFIWIYKDTNADLRFLLIGSLIPDIVDKLLYLLVITDNSRTYGHTLIFAVGFLFLIMIGTKKNSTTRKNYLLIPIALFIHLLLDEMWMFNETLFWPLFDGAFSQNFSSANSLVELFVISIGKTEIIVKEIIGGVFLLLALSKEMNYKKNLLNLIKYGKY